METFAFNWEQIVVDFIRVALSFILAAPLAWERIHGSRSLGLRTFPIVAIASCGYMLVAKSLAGGDTEAQGRVLQGLLTGIGFIGGGAILKQGIDVRGLATAASIWNTGAIGAAVALEREEIGLVLSLINFLALYFLTPLANQIKPDLHDASADEADHE